ncbi:protein transport protein SEC9-like [Vicia villosa]|uniref:protein transport protein SEC9-like n=1 Tax=Vicia villosa TaxID=3911 RepID=UPI00273ABF7F|nr:protein transport protein SEC9-like [Vicia villosa]
MAAFGYAYRSVSTYSTTRTGSGEPSVIKPFAPFVPKSNGSNYSEGAVTKKIVVPVTSRPYDEPAAEKYASSGDESEDEFHHRTSPDRSSYRKDVDKFPAKVQQNHEGGRNPQRLGPIVDRGRHSPQPTAEGRKPIGISPIKIDHRSAVGDPNPHKEGRKPFGGDSSVRRGHDGYDNNGYGSDKGHKPIENGIKSGSYDSPKRYSGDHGAAVVGDPNPYKEGHKPIGTGSLRGGSLRGGSLRGGSIRGGSLRGGSLRGARDGYNNGYGGDKEGSRPIESNIKNGNYEYDSPNRYGGDHRGAPVVGDPSPYKEVQKPIGGGSIRTSRDGYNNGDKEGYKPIIRSNIQNGYYDSPNGYGGDYKEAHKPIGGGNIQNDYYDSPNGYGSDYNKKEGYMPMRNGNYGNSNGNVPKISSDWSAGPRKGIQLSEPTHDIDKALELLRIEAANRDRHHESNNDHHPYYNSPSPTALDKWNAPAPGNGSPRFTDRTGSAGIMKPHGNVNQLQSRPRNSPIHVTFVDDVRDYGDDDYYRRGDLGRYGYRDAVIDSREAEKKFKGTRV